MAIFNALHSKIYLHSLDLTGLVHRVGFGPLVRKFAPSQTLADGGYDCVLPASISGSATLEGYQDFATLDGTISIGQLGSQYPLTIFPNPTGTVAAGDRAWLARGRIAAHAPMVGGIDEMDGFATELAYDAGFPLGYVAHPLTARTTTDVGTAVALGGPTADQKLWATLHVTAFSGLTNIVVKVQTDDGAGFGSATDRITFTTVTGTTSEFASVAGAFASETHARVSWTVTGTGSCTFVAAFGVI